MSWAEAQACESGKNMLRFNTCSNCGRRISRRYTRCYNCEMRRRRSSWHDPEHLSGQAKRDAKLGRKKFFVYLLDTDYGHYVGHSANVRARVKAHTDNKVKSTAGGDPKLLWTSSPFSTREDAAGFEAALKSWRDQSSERFQEITGHDPIPLKSVAASGSGCGLKGIIWIAVIFALFLFILGILQPS